MLSSLDNTKCCGCAACAASCPQECITMGKGTLGHLYPFVDEQMCISCGECKRVCPIGKTSILNHGQRVYASYSLDKYIRFNGSSGGLFETFARKAISMGYVVYGAAFNENLELKCTCAESELELGPLLKSKYIQSDIQSKYKEIQARLEDGKAVLVVSTPCQIRALKLFLNREYENLITIDFFCHGVPSQHFFNQCRTLEEKRLGGDLLEYTFRVKKRNGSTPHYYAIRYCQKGEIKSKTRYYFSSPYYAFFQRYISLRDSCYQCEFSSQNRDSDITIGDFHDIERYLDDVNRFDGVSMLVLNSNKGEALFRACTQTLYTHEFDLEQLVKDQVCFSGGTPRPKERDAFVFDYENMSIDKLAKKYVSSKRYIKFRIYYSLPKKIRNVVKNTIGVKI